MGLKHRLNKAHRETQAERDMEGLKDLFMDAVRRLRTQASGESPPNEAEGARHVVVDVEHGTRGVVTEIRDYSE